MNSCTYVATALHGSHTAAKLLKPRGIRNPFPPFSPAVEHYSREVCISTDSRRNVVACSRVDCFDALYKQRSLQQTFYSLWQHETKAFYSKEVHEHFFNPRNAGAFDMSDPDTRKKVGTAVVGKAACGDVIKLQVMIEDGKIKDARFKTFGCGSAIASSSYATEIIKGKSCEDALRLKNTEIAEYLSLPPVKVHCSLLAEDAVRHAIEDYQKKQASSEKSGGAAASASHEDSGSSTTPPPTFLSESLNASSDSAISSSQSSTTFATMNKESTSTASAAQR